MANIPPIPALPLPPVNLALWPGLGWDKVSNEYPVTVRDFARPTAAEVRGRARYNFCKGAWAINGATIPARVIDPQVIVWEGQPS